MAISYLLDENLARLWRVQLLRRLPSLTVWMVGDPSAPATGTLDPEILLWCEVHRFILVTNNRRSMPRHLADHLAAGRQVPGILVLRKNAAMGQVIEDLILIAEVAGDDDYQNLISYVPLK
ncbi:MAG: hypothetical protein VKJ46_03830 [Leptolyngbyaceae bacterium]|nr:hypothetical protein [Leptolyngbyaceae bacterium]